MANSENGSCLSLRACAQRGTYVDLKGKLRKDEIATRNEQKKIIFVFDDVIEGGLLHQSGIRDGDELTTVNNAEVKSFHAINHIASAIRDCSSAIMLGMKRRRRRFGSVPFVVLFQLGDEDPVHKFCGFYWNVSPGDIPFIPSCCKCDDIVLEQSPRFDQGVDIFQKVTPCFDRFPSMEIAEVVIQDGNQYRLTFNGSTTPPSWTFESTSGPCRPQSPCSTFQLEVRQITLEITGIAFRPQNRRSLALEATRDNKLKTSRYRGIRSQFFHVTLRNPTRALIQSPLTNWYLGKREDDMAGLFRDERLINLLPV